jgi:hypothetical protein
MENTHNHDLEVISFPIDFMDYNLQHFGDEFTASVEAFGHQFSVDQYCAEVEAEFSLQFDEGILFDNDDNNSNNNDKEVPRERKEWSPNAYQYQFGNVYEANWYVKFIHASVRDRTYYLSLHDSYGEFRSLFRMPLLNVDDLVSLYVENGKAWQTKHCESEEEVMIRLELHVMGV